MWTYRLGLKIQLTLKKLISYLYNRLIYIMSYKYQLQYHNMSRLKRKTPDNKQNINKLFKISILNNSKDTEKWNFFKKKADDIGYYDYNKFSSIDKTVLQNVINSNTMLSDYIMHMFKENSFGWNIDIITSALTHLCLWNNLTHSNYKYYIIFEDDIEFCDNFNVHLNILINKLHDNNYPIIFLGYSSIITKAIKNSHICIKQLSIDDRTNMIPNSNFGYVISRTFARDLMLNIENHGLNAPIDKFISKFSNINEITIPLVLKNVELVGDNFEKLIIQDNKENKKNENNKNNNNDNNDNKKDKKDKKPTISLSSFLDNIYLLCTQYSNNEYTSIDTYLNDQETQELNTFITNYINNNDDINMDEFKKNIKDRLQYIIALRHDNILIDSVMLEYINGTYTIAIRSTQLNIDDSNHSNSSDIKRIKNNNAENNSEFEFEFKSFNDYSRFDISPFYPQAQTTITSNINQNTVSDSDEYDHIIDENTSSSDSD